MSKDRKSETAALRARRVKLADIIESGIPTEGPWIMDWRSYDIPATVSAGIRNADPGCVAVSLSMMGGREMIFAAERAASDKGIRVLWWFGPSHQDLTDDGKAQLRASVIEARCQIT